MPTQPKTTRGTRGKKALKVAAEREVQERIEYKAEALVSKHSHGPAGEVSRPAPKRGFLRRKRLETYTGPGGRTLRLTKAAIVSALVFDYPDWTDRQIAAAAGLNKRSLYKLKFYSQARRLQQGWHL